MYQLKLPFDEVIEAENAEIVYHIPHFEAPKDLNETLLNLQYDWLIHKNQRSWARLWEIAIYYAKSEIKKTEDKRGFKYSVEERYGKAIDAVAYVLRRYEKNRGWCVHKSFISQLYGGVMHSLWSMNNQQKFEEKVEYIDYEEAYGDKEEETTWAESVKTFNTLAFTKEYEMKFQEAIKEYFIKSIETDAALEAVYDEEKMDACCEYIRKQAQKHAVKGCACIEDTIVYKWARDYMYGDIEPDDKPIVKPGKKDTSHEPSEDVELDGENSCIKPFVQKTAVVEKKAPADDPRQLNLFDFGGNE